MQWKSVLLQSVLVFVAVLVGTRLFAPNHTQDLRSLYKSVTALSEQIQPLEDRLSKVESVLAKHSESISAALRRSQATPGVPEMGGSPRSGDPALRESPPVPDAMAPSRTSPPPADPTGWIRELSEDKRAKVEGIFKDRGSFLQQRLPALSEGAPPDFEAVREIMEENDRQLKQELRMVLNDDEYQKFLNSLPKKPTLPAPGSPAPFN